MYWKFNLITTNIDSILDKGEEVTLQELLEEDDVLQECKAQNKKLLDFLIKDNIIEELVTLTLQEPSEELEEKVRFKYPNIACELLTSDVAVITDKLGGDEALLNKVYAFMESEAIMNPLQASFFSKVMGLLITRKSEQMVDFLRSKEGFVTHLLRHIGTSAIMDLLLRLITCVEGVETRNLCVNWLNDQHIVQRLVGLIDTSESEDKNCNAAQSLCDIIRLTREQMSQLQEKADEDPLLATIESQEVVADLVRHMFSGETKVESPLVSGLQVLQALLEFRKPATMTLFGPEGVQELTPLDSERLAKGVTSTVQALCPALHQFHQLLQEPPQQFYSSMHTTAGRLEPPLGSTRLQIIKLITTLIQTNHPQVNDELVRLSTVKLIVDLNFKYLWNNFLHAQVEQLLSAIFNAPPIEKEEGIITSPLLLQLFRDCNVVKDFMDRWDENDDAQTRPGGCRRGYMGHLTHYCNIINEKLQSESEKTDTTNSEVINQLFKECSEDLQKRWETFTAESLAEVNKQNTLEPVASNTFHSSSDSEDPDFTSLSFPQDSAMQQQPKVPRPFNRQAFSDYQLQQMTSAFVDQFGFHEDEFNDQQEPIDAPFNNKISSIDFDIATSDSADAQALFEQACNQRMHQFDDPDSDEDLFEDKEITFNKLSPNTTTSSPAQRPGQGRTRRDSQHDSDDDEDEEIEDRSESSDSEEDLPSPKRIFQTPLPSPIGNPPESMEVDSSDSWTNGEEANMAEVAPIAMDTNPWESNNQPAKAAAGENWAQFDQSSSESGPSDSGPVEKELQFTSFANFDDMQTNDSENPEEPPRPASPVPMAVDTNDDSAVISDRMKAYLTETPTELGEEESQQTDTPALSSDTLVSAQTPEKDADEFCSPPSTPRQAWSTPTPPAQSAEHLSSPSTSPRPHPDTSGPHTAASEGSPVIVNHVDNDASTSQSPMSQGPQDMKENKLGHGDEVSNSTTGQGQKSPVVVQCATISSTKEIPVQAESSASEDSKQSGESSAVDETTSKVPVENCEPRDLTTNEATQLKPSEEISVSTSPNGPV